MDSIWELLSLFLIMLVGGMFSYEGFQAIQSRKTWFRTYIITGRRARFIGILQMIIGLPLFLISFLLGVFTVVSLME